MCSYTFVQDSVQHVAEYLQNAKRLFVDTETTGLNPHTDELLLLTISDGVSVFVCDVRTIKDLDVLKPLFENEQIEKIFHNAVFDMKFLFHRGFWVRRPICTFVTESLLVAGLPFSRSLSAVVERRLGQTMAKDIRETFTSGSFVLTEEHISYAAKDVMVLPQIFDMQMKEIEELGLKSVWELEQNILFPTMLMEYHGVRMNVEKLKAAQEPMERMLKTLTRNIQSLCIRMGFAEEIVFSKDGYTAFNLSSPKQVLHILNMFGIDVESVNAKELTSWDIRNGHKKDSELENIESDDFNVGFHHPVLKLFSARAIVEKILNTYVIGLQKRLIGDRIYPSFNQVGAASTGRYSSSNPNFQNMVKKNRLESIGLGDHDIRSMFIPDEGNLFIISDYSAIELVIAGLFAEDDILLRQIESGDVHSYVATSMFGVEVNSENRKKEPYATLRDASKTLTYAKLYGTTGANLERTLGPRLASVGIDVRPGDGDKWIKAWNDTFPKTGEFLKKNADNAVRKGYVCTIMGRRRNWVTSFSNTRKFLAAQRQGSNSGIQGSSADLIKMAIYMLFQKIDYPSERIVATIHDEIICEVPAHVAEQRSEIVKQCMEEAGRVLFPLANKYYVIKAEPKISNCYDK